MTKREGAIITAFTGIMVGDFSDFHKYAEEIMESPIFTHQFGNEEFCEKLKEKVRPDFVKICENLT